MTPIRLLLWPALAGLGLAGCVAYPAAPPPYAGPPMPVYVAPAPPPPVYVRPVPRQRVWVPRRCDAYGRCRGGYWGWR
ncbi:MAG TPA: hypothetical protein VN329_14060 [Roseomonas sp.]|nr:hypothetical protein [Roseomonas sp.]